MLICQISDVSSLLLICSVNKMDTRRTLILSAVLFVTMTSSFTEELDDSFLTTRRDDDIWIIKFYAPWCSLCEQLDSVWRQIGSELKSLGSPVNVGKCDASANSGLAKEFRVKGYPSILMWKNHLKYKYSGPRTRDAILDFTHRVSGPAVRSLNSPQILQHAINRHDVMFVYVGATSPLKGNFTSVAEEMIVHTHFFSAARDVLKDVSLSSLPTVLLFKDTTFHIYTEENDGDLRSWVNRERFPYFSKIDSFTLYAMGESGKLVGLVLVEERTLSEESDRFTDLLRKVTSEQKHVYSRHFYFGVMIGSDYIKGLIMSDDVIQPSFLVLNLSNDSYFLPEVPVKTEHQLRDFIDRVMDGSVQSQGGNDVIQRIKRLIYEAKAMLTLVFIQAPLLGCFLLSFPLIIASAFFYLCCKPRPLTSDDDSDVAAVKNMADKKTE